MFQGQGGGNLNVPTRNEGQIPKQFQSSTGTSGRQFSLDYTDAKQGMSCCRRDRTKIGNKGSSD